MKLKTITLPYHTKDEPTVSHSSPKKSRRGCLCPKGNKYSVKCCNGTMQAQGIGLIYKKEK
jgi:hypothetical protein